MQLFAHFLVRRTVAWATVFIVFMLSMASLFYASRVDRDDDVLAFLPRQNPEVGIFMMLVSDLASLDVALVGVAADDVFGPDFCDVCKRSRKSSMTPTVLAIR